MLLIVFTVAIIGLVTPGSAFVARSTALNVRVSAHRDECFFEDVHAANTKVLLHFAVTNGGALDIDASIFAPDGQPIWSAEKEIEGRVLFKAKMPGPHKFCFSNKMSTVTTKTVTFAVQSGDLSESESGFKTDPMQELLSHITEGLTEIKNEQTYLRARERIHSETADSINARVLHWSLGEMLLIVGITAANIRYLVSRFEKRRNV